MERSRAFRRGQLQRAKTKAMRLAVRWGLPTSRWRNTTWEEVRGGWVGQMASTHCKPCSCSGCGNPRRHFGQRSRQELLATLAQDEQENEAQGVELLQVR